MSPIQGFVRLHQWQVGKQTVFGTAVTPTRVLPYRGDADIDLGFEDIDVDVGLLDPALDEYRTATDITATLEGPLFYNEVPLLVAASSKGGTSPTSSSTSRTWTTVIGSDVVDPRDYFTHVSADDTHASDGFQFRDGIIESLTLTMPENLGPWTVSADWRWGAIGTYPTARQTLSGASNTLVPVFGADTEFFLNNTAGAIGSTKLTDIVRGAEITINNNVDLKRYANGSNSRFQLAGYGFSGREITVTLTLEKQSVLFAETALWLGTSPTDRFFEIKSTSPDLAAAGIPYSNSLRGMLHWRLRTAGSIGGNATAVLEGRGMYDGTLGYPLRFNTVNTQGSLP